MIPGITAVRMTGARHRAELPLLVLGPSLGTSAATLWARLRRAASTDDFDVRRLGPARPRPQPGGARRAVHDGRARRRRARVVDDVLAQRGDRCAVPLRRRLGRRRGRAAAAARRARPGARRGAAAAPARRSATTAMWRDRIGQVRVSGTAVAGERARRSAGSRPASSSASPSAASALLHALQRRRRRGLRRRSAARSRRSTSATGSARSPRRCSRWPARTTRSRPPDLLREIADGVQRRPARRARRRRPPGAGRGARGGGATDPPARARREPEVAVTDESRRRHGRAPRGARRRARRPRDRRRHRLHPRLPGADHRVRLGQHLDPPRPRPAQPLADHADRAGRPRPPRGARAARARRPHATA